MSSDDVIVEAGPLLKVLVTALHSALKTWLLLDTGDHLIFWHHHESQISCDHSVVESVMTIP